MYYRNSFQRAIVASKFTLPSVAIFSTIMWALTYSFNAYTLDACQQAHGLWYIMPEALTTGVPSLVMGFVACTLAVYLMAEFNNKFVLLRISSRMLSTLLGVLLTACAFIHQFQLAHIVLLLTLATYFPFFDSYQNHNSMPQIFIAYLLIGISSLFFPKYLFLVPIYWVGQIVLRSFTLRTFGASVFGCILPYWLFFGTAFVNDELGTTLEHFTGCLSFAAPDFSQWTLNQNLMVLFTLILAAFGIVDFYNNSYKDKTKARITYNVVVIFVIASFLFLILDTSHFNEIFPIVLINTAIISGHHLAQSSSRFSNIYTIVCTICIACIMVANLMGEQMIRGFIGAL